VGPAKSGPCHWKNPTITDNRMRGYRLDRKGGSRPAFSSRIHASGASRTPLPTSVIPCLAPRHSMPQPRHSGLVPESMPPERRRRSLRPYETQCMRGVYFCSNSL
jgi:hypothetical protein